MAALPGRSLDEVAQQPRERLVEADQERVVALPRKLSSFFGREQGLAGSGRTDDMDAPIARQPAQDVLLNLGHLDRQALALADLAAEEAPQVDRLREKAGQQLHAGPTRRSFAGRLGRPDLERSLDGSARGRGVIAWQRVMVEHELGQDVRAEEPSPGAGARQIDIGQGDGVAGDRMEVRRSARELVELPKQGVKAPPGLFEGIGDERVAAREPAAARVAPDLAALDLDDEEAAIRMGDHEIRLAVADLAVVAGSPGPGHVREHPIAVRLRQRGADSALDEELGAATAGGIAPALRSRRGRHGAGGCIARVRARHPVPVPQFPTAVSTAIEPPPAWKARLAGQDRPRVKWCWTRGVAGATSRAQSSRAQSSCSSSVVERLQLQLEVEVPGPVAVAAHRQAARVQGIVVRVIPEQATTGRAERWAPRRRSREQPDATRTDS